MPAGRFTETGQRWVNELTEFSFSYHCRHTKSYIRTNSLELIQSSTETVLVEMMKALLDRSDLPQENYEPVAVCLKTSIKEQINILDNKSK